MRSEDVFRYDAFISYSHHDKDWVQGWLLPRLEQAGLRICIDFRDFEPGAPGLVNMENAVERSRKTLIVLTPAWVKSEWTAFESLLIQTDDPAGRRARMIPLRLKPCKPPKRIAMLTYVDFTQKAEAEIQLQRLIEAIRAGPTTEVSRSVRDRRRRWLVAVLALLVVAIVTWFWPGIRALPFPAISTTMPTLTSVQMTPVVPIACEKFEDPGRGFLFPPESSEIPEKPDAIKLSWDVTTRDSYAGCVVHLSPEFGAVASNNKALVIWVQGERGGEKFRIGLRSDRQEWKEVVTAPKPGRQIVIPLTKFTNRGVKLTGLNALIIAFEYNLGEEARKGVMHIGEIGFGSP